MEQNYIGSAHITYMKGGSVRNDSVERKGSLMLLSDTDFMREVRKIARFLGGSDVRIEYHDAVMSHRV